VEQTSVSLVRASHRLRRAILAPRRSGNEAEDGSACVHVTSISLSGKRVDVRILDFQTSGSPAPVGQTPAP
jgi:hypothetical protein